MGLTGNLTLNGKDYRVDNYKWKDLSDFGPRASTPGGSVAMSELGLYQPLSQTDWRHGFGFQWYTDAMGYLSTSGNIDTRHEGIAMMFTAATSSDTDNNRKDGFVNFNNALYAWTQQGDIRKFTVAGGWTLAYDPGFQVYTMLSTTDYLFAFLNGYRPRAATTTTSSAGNTASAAFLQTYHLTPDNVNMTFTAKATGAAGNLISITYATGAALSVAVTGSDIVVTLNAGTSTVAQVKTAIEAKAEATALVSLAYPTGSTGAGVCPLMSKIYLTGGSDVGRCSEYTTFINVAQSNLTVRSVTPGTGGNAYTLTYQTGASAVGKETALIVGSAVTVTLHADSTANDVLAALNRNGTEDYAHQRIFGRSSDSGNGDIILTAKTIGPYGEQIGIRYKADVALGSETCTVSGFQITVHINYLTTASRMISLINGTTAAAVLLTASLPTGKNGSGYVTEGQSVTWWRPAMGYLTLRGGSHPDITQILSVELAPGSDGTGKPGAMTAKTLGGGSGVSGWTNAGLDIYATDYHWALIHNGKVFAGQDGSHFIHYASESDLSDLEGDGKRDAGVIICGQGNTPTLGAIVYSANLYVSKPDGLWQVGEDSICRRVLDYSGKVSSNNFRSMAVFNGQLIYPIGDRLYGWNGSRTVDITPGKLSDTFPYTMYGEFDNFVTADEYMYYTAKISGSSFVYDLLCYDGVAHFKLCTLTTTTTQSVTAMAYDAVNNYLWYHIYDSASGGTNTTYYIQLNSRSEFPYANFPTSGTHYLETSRIDLGYRRVVKSTPSVLVEASGVSSTVKLTVYYSIDGATYVSLGDVTAAGVTELSLTTPIEYKYLKLKVVFVTGTATLSPILEGLTVRFLMRPDTFYGWSFDVVVARDVEHGPNVDNRTAKEIITNLKTARASKSAVSFTDMEGDTYKVYVSALTGHMLETHLESPGATPDNEHVVQVSVVEAT